MFAIGPDGLEVIMECLQLRIGAVCHRPDGFRDQLAAYSQVIYAEFAMAQMVSEVA